MAWCISCVCGCQVWARVCEKCVDGVLCGAQPHKCPTVLYTGLYCIVLYDINSQPLRQRVALYTALYCTVLYNISSQPLKVRVALYIALYCTLDRTVLYCIILPHNL